LVEPRRGGGGGGGALLIASSGTITFTGTLLATGGKGGDSIATENLIGGGGGGSGGGIRLAATTITGTGGVINVSGGARGEALSGVCFQRSGGAGGVGRVRIEGFTDTATITFVGTDVVPSVAPPSFVTLPNAPTLMITAVAGVAAPASPTGSFSNPDITLPATTTNPVTVDLAGANITVGTTVTVTVVGQTGGTISTTTTTLVGTEQSSTASASLTIPTDQPSIISASASFTIVASSGGGPVFVQGEEVERVRVTATFGRGSQVAYITKSGREIVLPVR
jgi:hypothetical protein